MTPVPVQFRVQTKKRFVSAFGSWFWFTTRYLYQIHLVTDFLHHIRFQYSIYKSKKKADSYKKLFHRSPVLSILKENCLVWFTSRWILAVINGLFNSSPSLNQTVLYNWFHSIENCRNLSSRKFFIYYIQNESVIVGNKSSKD